MLKEKKEVDYWKIASTILLIIVFVILFYSIYQDSKYIRTQIGDINKETYEFTETLREDFKYVLITNIHNNRSLNLSNDAC